MIKKGFATLTITLVLCAIAVIAVFYFGKSVLLNAKKVKDEAVYYEAYNAAHSGMTAALKTVTDNKKRLPCLAGSEQVKANGTVNNSCYCDKDNIAIKDGSKVVCAGVFSFKGEDRQNDTLISAYETTVRYNKESIYNVESLGRANGFEAVLRSVYQSIGGMKTIPKSAIVSTGNVYIVGNTLFEVANGSTSGGSIETGGKLFFDMHQGSKIPVYDFKEVKSGNKINMSSAPAAVDNSSGFNTNSAITNDNKASSVYLGDEFQKSKSKFLDVASVEINPEKRCQAMIPSLSKAKVNGKLDNHVWLDLNASSIHAFKVYPYIRDEDPYVWGCYLEGPLVHTDKPMNVVVNLTGLPAEGTDAYKYLIANGLTIYTNGGGPARGMISFIDRVKNSNIKLRFKALNTVQLVGTILLDSESEAWFESSFNLTYDSQMLNDMNQQLKIQGIMTGSWSDY